MIPATKRRSVRRPLQRPGTGSGIIGAMSDTPFDGAHPVAELLAGVRRRIAPEAEPALEPAVEPQPAAAVPTDDAQWEELAIAVDELVEVVLVQQDLIENLLLRMSRLEGRDVSAPVRRGA